ncbi:Prolyl 4-hydroxylase subunit alpha [Symbiodinium microadriaticum]|uniref:Prolyl 4-hydroxylase subunit alpha n=1 Tax=Symbiodinium microadriaticum TaxID=2951 RepID=A0A1Q9CTU3_SYMMI|nr:Prolyl 4-hydroxylase subunit alpha [Symbiodinium microadriaticum]
MCVTASTTTQAAAFLVYGCIRHSTSCGFQCNAGSPSTPVLGSFVEALTGYVVDVAPLADRLVLFSSEWLEHEVLPAYAERWAVTTWFY